MTGRSSGYDDGNCPQDDETLAGTRGGCRVVVVAGSHLVRTSQAFSQRQARAPPVRELRRELDLLPAIAPPRRRLGAVAAVAQEMRRVPQRDLVLGRGRQREKPGQGPDDVRDGLGGHAVVHDVEEADVDERVAELVEQRGLRCGVVGEGEVDLWDFGEARCHCGRADGRCWVTQVRTSQEESVLGSPCDAI